MPRGNCTLRAVQLVRGMCGTEIQESLLSSSTKVCDQRGTCLVIVEKPAKGGLCPVTQSHNLILQECFKDVSLELDENSGSILIFASCVVGTCNILYICG